MRILITISLLFLSSAMCFGSPPKGDLQYTRWANYRYGYEFELPDIGLIPGSESRNEEGREFVSGDRKLTISVWGTENHGQRSVKRMCSDMVLSFGTASKVTHRQVTQTGFTVSGQLNVREFYFIRSIYHDGKFFTVFIRYPKPDSVHFEPIVKHIAESFRYAPSWIGKGSGTEKAGE